MSNQLKVVTVDLHRSTRLKLLVPTNVDEDLVARCVEAFYDGSTMYGGGEENDAGDAVLRGDNPVENNAYVAESEPAEREDGVVGAVAAYWRWAAAEAA